MGQGAFLCEELFKLGPDTTLGVCWCLHSKKAAVVLFASCHQREMEKGWRVFSRLTHSAAGDVEKFPTCSYWLGLARTPAQWDVSTLCSTSQPQNLSLLPGRLRLCCGWALRSPCLKHVFLRNRLFLILTHLLKAHMSKLVAFPSCSLGFNNPKVCILSEESKQGGKAWWLGSSKAEQRENHRDIQVPGRNGSEYPKKARGFWGDVLPSLKTTVQYKAIDSFLELKGTFKCIVVLQYN